MIKRFFSSKKVLIVRHGESIWNQDSKFTGWTNIPLTNNGRDEAKKMALTLYILFLVQF